MTGIALTTTPWASREAQFTGEALATPREWSQGAFSGDETS
ncbi:hypothetical protein [Aquamicrobium zhengzhouense]|nr:hypothetical protein [Aquamicrobium zhengzhouense]